MANTNRSIQRRTDETKIAETVAKNLENPGQLQTARNDLKGQKPPKPISP
jgi:hypothetical protein